MDKTKIKKIIIALVALVVIAIVAIVITLNNSKTASTDKELLSIDTFGTEVCGYTIKYPVKWREKVKIDVSDNGARFTSGDAELFYLHFGGETGNLLGTLKDGDKSTVLRVESFTIDESNENYDELCAMCEDINVILVNLEKDYDFVIGEDTTGAADDKVATYKIKTKTVATNIPIVYNKKWEDKVTITEGDECLNFTCGEDKLFDLYFKKVSDGYLLGKYDGTPIYIVDYEVNNDEEAAMQEDVNVILQNLMKDKKFKVNKES